MLGTGYSMKSQKLIPSKKNQYALIANWISSRKTQKIANPQKFLSTRYYGFSIKNWGYVGTDGG